MRISRFATTASLIASLACSTFAADERPTTAPTTGPVRVLAQSDPTASIGPEEKQPRAWDWTMTLRCERCSPEQALQAINATVLELSLIERESVGTRLDGLWRGTTALERSVVIACELIGPSATQVDVVLRAPRDLNVEASVAQFATLCERLKSNLERSIAGEQLPVRRGLFGGSPGGASTQPSR